MARWTPPKNQTLFLSLPQRDRSLLPVPRRAARAPMTLAHGMAELRWRLSRSAQKDMQIMTEFKNKLRMAEDLISKLAFNLREIQNLKRKPAEESTSKAKRSFVARALVLIDRSKD